MISAYFYISHRGTLYQYLEKVGTYDENMKIFFFIT